jgi:tRNA/tmRNA/rRNA uracil-C5-methylase (TrmA/RlmC/RlmD family)
MTDTVQAAPKPVPGQVVTLSIHDIAFGGEGVARLDNFVVFIPFVLPGEEVEAELTEVKKNFARARLRRVLQAAPERVEPPCRYFGECGGCQYQHVDYDAQLRLKHKQIADLLQRIGGFAASVISPVVPCPAPYGYRNRLMIRSQWDKTEQRLRVGFLQAESRLVVDVKECKIAEPEINEQILKVHANPPPKGGLKVVLRLAPEDWQVPPDSFFQNNFHLLPKLVETVKGRLKDSGIRHLVDAYCGVGFFGIECAAVVESFVGVEYDVQAIKAARQNAASHGVTNGEFIGGTTEELLPSLLRRFTPEATAVLLDPPRVGCQPESLQALRETGPRQIIYVSCHPATLARDLKLLCADRVYELANVTPLDMFPQTQHVECVADLRRIG